MRQQRMNSSFLSRRGFLRQAVFAAVAVVTRSAGGRPSASAAALARARDFLLARQDASGAWCSTQYGVLRGGDALTALALSALGSMNHRDDRGFRWLEARTAAQAGRPEPWEGLGYPLFTASYAAEVFAHHGDDGRRARFWADLLERLRISSALGWPAGSAACGAWGDASTPPQLAGGDAPPPDAAGPTPFPATVLALQGLAAAGRGGSAASALPFVAECQNFSSGVGHAFDDGGFLFRAR